MVHISGGSIEGESYDVIEITPNVETLDKLDKVIKKDKAVKKANICSSKSG